MRRRNNMTRWEFEAWFKQQFTITDNGCWEWQNGTHKFGHGKTSFRGEMLWTHRVAYEIYKGTIPEGAFVCHRCDNPPCGNPDHLFLGDRSINAKDMHAKGRGYVPLKATPANIRRIARMLENGMSPEAIAESYKSYAKTI